MRTSTSPAATLFAFALALAAATSGAAGAATAVGPAAPGGPDTLAEGRLIFATTIVNEEHPAGALEGTLDVRVGRGGTILGSYRGADSSRLLTVDGGIEGNAVHLNIPGFPEILGTVSDGGIRGFTVVRGEIERFTAAPETEQQP
jgi:hypothetical protein